MTRKRFVKLCMSKGYSRNIAELLARDALADYGNYADAWEALNRFAPVLQRLAEITHKVTWRFVDALSPALAAVGKALETLGRNLQEAFES